MPLPLLPALGLVAEFIAANGMRMATRRYGPEAVRKAMQEIGKRQAAINKRKVVQEARTAELKSPRSASSIEKQRLRALDKRLEKEQPRARFDEEGDLLPEIPLQFAQGDEVPGRNIPGRLKNVAEKVSSGRRPGTVGPNVQRNMPGRTTGVADKVLTGSGRPPVGTMATPKPGLLPTQTLSRMGMLSRAGGLGLLAAAGLGLFEIGRQSGFDPEKLGAAAAQLQKSLEEVANEAVEVATELGEPVQDFVGRVVQGYQSEMGGGRTMSDMDAQQQDTPFIGTLPINQIPGLEELGIPREEMAEGGDVSRETNEIESALSDIENVQPEAQVIQQVMTMVMELVQSGASEEEIVAALRQMGLDDEDIEQVMMMLAEQMQGQQDPIQSELSQMM